MHLKRLFADCHDIIEEEKKKRRRRRRRRKKRERERLHIKGYQFQWVY